MGPRTDLSRQAGILPFFALSLGFHHTSTATCQTHGKRTLPCQASRRLRRLNQRCSRCSPVSSPRGWSSQLGRTHQLTTLPSTAPEPSTETRRIVISSLLSSLQSFNPSTVPPSLLSVLKAVGRSPAGSEELGRRTALLTLLSYSGLSRLSSALPPLTFPPSASPVPAEESGRFSEVAEQQPLPPNPLSINEAEALRTLCNVLQLHPSGRTLFPSLLQETAGTVVGLVRLMGTEGGGFLAGRLLFLATSQMSGLVGELVDGVEVIAGLCQVRRSHDTPPCFTANETPTAEHLPRSRHPPRLRPLRPRVRPRAQPRRDPVRTPQAVLQPHAPVRPAPPLPAPVELGSVELDGDAGDLAAGLGGGGEEEEADVAEVVGAEVHGGCFAQLEG